MSGPWEWVVRRRLGLRWLLQFIGGGIAIALSGGVFPSAGLKVGLMLEREVVTEDCRTCFWSFDNAGYHVLWTHTTRNAETEADSAMIDSSSKMAILQSTTEIT